jgi:hypothetical protein
MMITKVATAALIIIVGIGLSILSVTILNANYLWVSGGYTGSIQNPDASTFAIITVLMILSLVLICLGCTLFPKKYVVPEEKNIQPAQSHQNILPNVLIGAGAFVVIIAGVFFFQFILVSPNPSLTIGGVPIETLVSAFSIIVLVLFIIGVPLLYFGVRLNRSNSTGFTPIDQDKAKEDESAAQALPAGTKKCQTCGAIIPEVGLYCDDCGAPQ